MEAEGRKNSGKSRPSLRKVFGPSSLHALFLHRNDAEVYTKDVEPEFTLTDLAETGLAPSQQRHELERKRGLRSSPRDLWNGCFSAALGLLLAEMVLG